MTLAPKLALPGPGVLEPGCTHMMPVRGSLLQAPHGATSPTHPPSGYPRPSGQEQRPCPAAAGSQCSGPRWAFPDRQAASADRSFFRSSRPRGLCSLEAFFQTGLAEPGHGPQWVLWARTRGPGPTAHPGGLADAQQGPGRTGSPCRGDRLQRWPESTVPESAAPARLAPPWGLGAGRVGCLRGHRLGQPTAAPFTITPASWHQREEVASDLPA